MQFPVRTVLGVVGVAAALGGIVLGTTLLFSTSADLQTPPKPIGYRWRDSGLTTQAISIIVAILVVQSASRLGRFGRTAVQKSLLVGGLAVIALSFVTSSSVTNRAMTNQERRLNNQIALAAVEFETDDLGNSQRCQLLALWTATLYEQQAEFRPAQLERSLNEFVSYAHGATEFCTAEP